MKKEGAHPMVACLETFWHKSKHGFGLTSEEGGCDGPDGTFSNTLVE